MSDTVPRPDGCQCQWEAGDSPCRVHGEDEKPMTDPMTPEELQACRERAEAATGLSPSDVRGGAFTWDGDDALLADIVDTADALAALRADVPRLLATVDAAQRETASLRHAALFAAGVCGGPGAWRWASDPEGTILDDVAAWERLLGEMRATRSVLAALIETFEAVLAEADRPKGGMSVPFHGDFAGALRLPSVLGNMRWWAKEARRVLSGEASAVEHWARAGEASGRP